MGSRGSVDLALVDPTPPDKFLNVHVDPLAPSRIDPALSPDIDHVLFLAMAKDPRERYASPSDLARDLRAAFTGELDAEVRVRAGRVTRAKPPTPALDRTITAPSVPRA